MTNDELNEQIRLTEALAAAQHMLVAGQRAYNAELTKTKELLSELPTEEQLESLCSSARALASHLSDVKDAYADEGFPDAEQIEELSNEAGRLASSLKEAAEAQAEVE